MLDQPEISRNEIMKKSSLPYEVRVKVRGFRKYKGYSNLVETYCCSATPCYYVIFPAISYEGYFEKYDVEVKKELKPCDNKKTG